MRIWGPASHQGLGSGAADGQRGAQADLATAGAPYEQTRQGHADGRSTRTREGVGEGGDARGQ